MVERFETFSSTPWGTAFHGTRSEYDQRVAEYAVDEASSTMADERRGQPFRQAAPDPPPEPDPRGFSIALTPKGINALIIAQHHSYADLGFWDRLWGWRAHRRKLEAYRSGAGRRAKFWERIERA